MPTAEELLREIYASNPEGSIVYELLELKHPAFLTDDGVYGSWRMVRESVDSLQVTLETGDTAVFEPGPWSVRWPKKGVQGRRDARLVISAVSRKVIEQLERVADMPPPRVPIRCILRKYASTDLSYPAEVEELVISKPQANSQEVTASAVFLDPVNMQFPRRLYDISTHPGLVE